MKPIEAVDYLHKMHRKAPQSINVGHERLRAIIQASRDGLI